MAINEHVGDLGYMSLIKEATPGIPLTPTTYIPMYDDGGMGTDLQLDEVNPVIGNKFARYKTIMGLRKHGGSPTVMGTPNIAAYLMDMMMTKGNVTTPNYTYPFTLTANDPNSYTIDISNGFSVSRFIGCQVSSLKPVFSKNEVRLQPKISALKSFVIREIATWTAGTKTLTLKTTYDPIPNFGLVVGDTLQFTGAGAGTTPVSTTIAAAGVNADGITVVLTSAPAGLAAGDFVTLAPLTVTLVDETPFTWGRTEFHFGATVTAALAAAATPCEVGSDITLMHNLESESGAPRSGSYDPAALVRTVGDASGKIKKFFGTMDELNRFITVGANPQAVVMKMLSGTAYELRFVLDQVVYKTSSLAVKSGSIIYNEFDIIPVYNVANSEGMSALVSCAITSL